MRTQEFPLISCLMVTRGGLFPGRMAIDCYRRQTWPNRELVVLCDAPDAPIARYVESLGDSTIRYVETAPKPLGELRNESIEVARGDLLCQWDDDDLYHPNRLTRQQKVLSEAPEAAAHFLQRWTIWWPGRRLIGLGQPRVWEGSMLARREKLPPYEALARNEDALMVLEMSDRHDIVLTEEPHLYCYIIHGRNTWDQPHFERMMRHSLLFADYETHFERNARNLPLRDYERELLRREGDLPLRVRQEEPDLIIGRDFGEESVTLDGGRFFDCRFEGTKMHYGGGAPPYFGECSFRRVELVLAGSAKDSYATLRWLTDAGVIPGIVPPNA